MKTSELTGAALDWAVAKCGGIHVSMARGGWFVFDSDAFSEYRNDYNDDKLQSFKPSTNWAQGGPIIEREGVAIDCIQADGEIAGWIAQLPMFREAKYEKPSPTPLIAAMRCYVASKLGDTIDIPEELK